MKTRILGVADAVHIASPINTIAWAYCLSDLHLFSWDMAAGERGTVSMAPLDSRAFYRKGGNDVFKSCKRGGMLYHNRYESSGAANPFQTLGRRRRNLSPAD